MCNVDKPEVYSNQAPRSFESKTWLSGVDKIKKAGSQTQRDQKWRGETDPDTYNEVLHDIAKAFFKEKNHGKAVFIPYWATISEKYFSQEEIPGKKFISIDYFYRILIDASGKESEWDPKSPSALDIWDQANACFKVVLYGFLENLKGGVAFNSGVKNAKGVDVQVPYTQITLHEAPYIYWLGIPDDLERYI